MNQDVPETRDSALLANLLHAVREWAELRDRMEAKTGPTHTDYWHQSIDDTNRQLRDAWRQYTHAPAQPAQDN